MLPSFIIVTVILAYAAWVIRNKIKRMKEGKFGCGSCSGCDGCPSQNKCKRD